LTAAVVLGVTLALQYLRGRRVRIVGLVHGLVGAGGLLLLVIALQGPRRGDAMGVGSFGTAAAVLFSIALALGLVFAVLRAFTPRLAGIVIATHASAAITAYVLFLAWVSIG
jgi:hypothetical protein